jgi:hypothetical protein
LSNVEKIKDFQYDMHIMWNEPFESDNLGKGGMTFSHMVKRLHGANRSSVLSRSLGKAQTNSVETFVDLPSEPDKRGSSLGPDTGYSVQGFVISFVCEDKMHL